MSINMKTYLVLLTPLADFFFGGVKKGGLSKKSDYYLKSKLFPQQTAILGMIRYELLRQNNLLIKNNFSDADRNKAVTLVGEKGFDPVEDDQDFGVIKNISPVFIRYNRYNYHPVPVNYGLEYKISNGSGVLHYDYRSKPVNGIPLLKSSDNSKISQIIEKNFKILRAESTDILISFDDIFSDIESVGIKKDFEGETQKDAYYKRVSKRMKSGYSFGFYLTIDMNENYKLESSIIRMGGEQSAFIMKLDKVDGEAGNLFEDSLFKIDNNYVYIASDMNIDNDFLSSFDFFISDDVVLKGIVSSIKKTESFYNLSKNSGNNSFPWLYKSLKLLKKGSVLYYSKDKVEKIKNSLENIKTLKPQFRKIGYNYYKMNNE